jgi:hypothetical protein
MADLNQLPAEQSISFVRGDDYKLDVEIQDGNENPIDFSSWSNIFLQVRNLRKYGGNLLDEYVSPTDISVTSGGRVELVFPSADTKQWENQRIVYELEGDDGNGLNRSIMRGQIKLVDEISV